MRKFSITAVGLLLAVFVIFGFCTSTSFGHFENDAAAGDSIPLRLTTSPYIPEKVDFAGEPMPLALFDVRESLERELMVNMNFHSNTLQYLKRTARYFPVIEPILAENGVPDDFKYLSLIESDFMNKVSPRGATGFWQFMKGAAADYGLEVNNEVDERYHIEKSTVAACKYLKDAYRIYGNWTMAAASYNMGKAGLNRQVKRQQCDYYYDLLLNDETMRYIYRISAVKLLLNAPAKYGFYVPENEKYQAIPFTEVEVKTTVSDWTVFAFNHQTNYKILKYLNPWLRDNKLTNPLRKSYMVKIPSEGFRDAAKHRIDKGQAEKIEEESAKNKSEVQQ